MSERAITTLPPIPTSRDDLLIAALRHANTVSGLLNDISAEISRVLGASSEKLKYDPLHNLLTRRFSDASSVFLFIAANNLQMELPADLKGEEIEPEDSLPDPRPR